MNSIKKMPVVITMEPQHAKALELKAGIHEFSARDSEITDWINELMTVSLIAEDEAQTAMKELLCTGFLLGYQMRGFDYLLDFHLTKNEALSSIIATQNMLNRLIDEDEFTPGQFLKELGIENE